MTPSDDDEDNSDACRHYLQHVIEAIGSTVDVRLFLLSLLPPVSCTSTNTYYCVTFVLVAFQRKYRRAMFLAFVCDGADAVNSGG